MTSSSVVLEGGPQQVSQRAADKFSFVRDLGRVRVPRDWGSAVCYSDLQILCSLVASAWDPRISELSFPRASHELRSNVRYVVQLFEPVNPSSTTVYEDALLFLESKKALLVGVPGLVLLMSERQEGFANQFSEYDMFTMPDVRRKLFRDPRADSVFLPTCTKEDGKFKVELHDATNTWAPQHYLPVFTEYRRP